MPSRVSRRRAVVRGLTLLGGLALVLPGGRPSAAQPLDPPSDVPWAPPGEPEPPAEVAPVSDDGPVDDAAGDSPAAEPEPAEPEPLAAGPWGVPPVKLMLPSVGVEAAVEPVAEDPDGAMSAPTDPDQIAWYSPGPGMGVPGNVVFAGHVDWAGRRRVFGDLHLLNPGDPVQVIDAEGRGYEYAVESSEWVRAEGAPVEAIFANPGEPVVTLITCGGEYVAARREYLDRLIVRARGA